MTPLSPLTHQSPDLLASLEQLDEGGLDGLNFGVIGFGADTRVRRYNAAESQASRLAPAEVLDQPLFTDVAQCMNNYLVAQRFEDALASGQPLDDTIDYLLTWRMRPTPVKLRLLAAPGVAMRYVVLHRLA